LHLQYQFLRTVITLHNGHAVDICKFCNRKRFHLILLIFSRDICKKCLNTGEILAATSAIKTTDGIKADKSESMGRDSLQVQDIRPDDFCQDSRQYIRDLLNWKKRQKM